LESDVSTPQARAALAAHARTIEGRALSRGIMIGRWGTLEWRAKIAAGQRRRRAHETHCKNGHELTPDNLVRSAPKRRCRICFMAYQRERKRRLRRETLRLIGA
jgi:hypothetical protein